MGNYNERSSEDLGWLPAWFGCAGFGPGLQRKIKEYQLENDLEADGLCGPATYRRIYSDQMKDIDGEYIICNGQKIPIDWPHVETFDENPGIKSPNGSYKRRMRGNDRQVDHFIVHWDATLSAKHCMKILKRRKPPLSVHFCIDNAPEAKIYQLLDTSQIAYHAGGWNMRSVGVEISNAYSLRYQDYYIRRGHGPRPIIEGAKVRGRTLRPHLGFYEVQKRAAKALWEAVCFAHGIPLQTPTNPDGTERAETLSRAELNEYSGIIHHFQCSKAKIDCGGFDLTKWVNK